MSKPANKTTMLQIEVSEALAAGALCSVFQDRLLVPSYGRWAQFRAVCGLLPGDLIVIPDDRDGHPPELAPVRDSAEFSYPVYFHPRHHSIIFDISGIV